MELKKIREIIETLATRAAARDSDGNDAMKYSQAALNAANAFAVLNTLIPGGVADE